MDAEFIKQFANYGIGGLLGVIVMLFYRKDVQSMTDFWKQQTSLLTEVVKENTASNVRLTVVIESLHRRLDANGMQNGLKRPDGG